jgi:RNA polymerase sigma factor (TIGR02999 family)
MSQAVALSELFGRWRAGDPGVAEELVARVYGDLRRIARRQLARERAGHTLQPTALAHEAYLKLAAQERVAWNGRTHYLAVAALAMRRILVSHARERGAAKRGGEAVRVTLDPELAVAEGEIDVAALDEALEALASKDARAARVVELRFFGGLTIAETAEVLGVSPATVKVDWSLARSWLYRKLTGERLGR